MAVPKGERRMTLLCCTGTKEAIWAAESLRSKQRRHKSRSTEQATSTPAHWLGRGNKREGGENEKLRAWYGVKEVAKEEIPKCWFSHVMACELFILAVAGQFPLCLYIPDSLHVHLGNFSMVSAEQVNWGPKHLILISPVLKGLYTPKLSTCWSALEGHRDSFVLPRLWEKTESVCDWSSRSGIHHKHQINLIWKLWIKSVYCNGASHSSPPSSCFLVYFHLGKLQCEYVLCARLNRDTATFFGISIKKKKSHDIISFSPLLL